MAPPPLSSLKRTQETLEYAIAANQKLQDATRRQLIKLGQIKAENRRLASKLTKHMTCAWDQLDRRKIREMKISPIGDSILQSMITNDEIEELTTSSETIHGTKRKTTAMNKTKKTVAKKWNYDPYRRWTRRFFTDPNGSSPLPNLDAIRRRDMENGKLFFHTHPPWSLAEQKLLQQLVQKHRQEHVDALDWSNIANSLQSNAKISITKETKVPRTSEECRLFYLGLGNPSPFTKEESLATLQQIHSQGSKPSWTRIRISGRTTWQTFCHHQKMKLTNPASTNDGAWTPLQDEFLLKYMAAMGPQYILSIAESCRLSISMLQDKSPKNIMARANQSLLNPNLARSAWSTEEDMTLVLGMKIYQNDANPLVPAGNHLPRRASQSITAKWYRSLNPFYSTTPWTPGEDQRLIDVVKANNEMVMSWSELAQKYFPDRNPRTIQARWTEVASSHDFLQKYGEALKKRKARGTVLGTNDFVLRIRRSSLDGVNDESFDDDETGHD